MNISIMLEKQPSTLELATTMNVAGEISVQQVSEDFRASEDCIKSSLSVVAI
jgi:hypothetical protein